MFIRNQQTTADQDDDCQLKINAGPRNTLTQITIVCDSDVIELFTGSYEEYNQTYRGELLDEFDGIKSYLFEIKLKKDTDCVCLKVISVGPRTHSMVNVAKLNLRSILVYYTGRPIVDLWHPYVRDGQTDQHLSTVD